MGRISLIDQDDRGWSEQMRGGLGPVVLGARGNVWRQLRDIGGWEHDLDSGSRLVRDDRFDMLGRSPARAGREIVRTGKSAYEHCLPLAEWQQTLMTRGEGLSGGGGVECATISLHGVYWRKVMQRGRRCRVVFVRGA